MCHRIPKCTNKAQYILVCVEYFGTKRLFYIWGVVRCIYRSKNGKSQLIPHQKIKKYFFSAKIKLRQSGAATNALFSKKLTKQQMLNSVLLKKKYSEKILLELDL